MIEKWIPHQILETPRICDLLSARRRGESLGIVDGASVRASERARMKSPPARKFGHPLFFAYHLFHLFNARAATSSRMWLLN